jgi:hypothetical protein
MYALQVIKGSMNSISRCVVVEVLPGDDGENELSEERFGTFAFLCQPNAGNEIVRTTFLEHPHLVFDSVVIRLARPSMVRFKVETKFWCRYIHTWRESVRFAILPLLPHPHQEAMVHLHPWAGSMAWSRPLSEEYVRLHLPRQNHVRAQLLQDAILVLQRTTRRMQTSTHALCVRMSCT